MRFELRQLTSNRLWQTAQWIFAGVAGVALVTFAALRLHLSFAAASSCYLLLTILLSLAGDLVSSALVSLLAGACLDFFFVEPLFSLRVAKPFNLLELASFLTTGLVIAHLMTKVRARAEVSELHHLKLQRLYDLAQQLLALEPDVSGGKELLEPFVGVFGIRAVCVFDAVSAELHTAGSAGELLEKKTGDAFVRGRDQMDPHNGMVARCIRVAGRTKGAIGFEGLEDASLTAGPLAALAAAHLERAHSFRKASSASAAAQTESYRSAILDALAHEFKTPLATILAAAGALREVASLGPDHRLMAETVETEAARLGRLTSRLIRTARLEREEVKPWMELMDLSPVIADIVEQYAKISGDRTVSVLKECDSTEVIGDPELVRLALSQLLDNACKYSDPGSAITLIVSQQHDFVALRVVSTGNSIPAPERQKIFDRFYRGVDGQRMAPGSGLGLYVARKIALAHGGSLDLDTGHAPADGTAFCLMLPVPESERRERTILPTAV